MQLQLKQLIPIPLQDRPSLQSSGIWTKELAFDMPAHIFIQAPSGTGKTTLIQSLYGIRNDYIGDIYWEGKTVRAMNKEELSVLRSNELSIIFQDLRLFPGLTAWENLEIKRSLTNTVDEHEVTAWMNRLGIGNKKEAVAHTLSYGERQRVAIIRALLQPFRWLLMDEPFSHLDKKNTALAVALITEVIQRNNAGMILADLDENTYFPYHQTITL